MRVIETKLPRVRPLPPGPWDDEPDKVQWPSETGLACMVRRGPMGVWCGYAGLPPEHPAFGVSYMDLSPSPEVHGGLTYSEACDGDEEAGICHVPEPGEPEPLWWFGFDCGHAWDLIPSMLDIGLELPGGPDNTYKNLAYVKAETEHLAEQLAQMAVPA